MRVGSLVSVRSKLGSLLAVAIVAIAGVTAQAQAIGLQAKPTALPADLAADSYAIYSELLPGREIEWGDVPRSFWLLEAVTKALPLSDSCASSGEMNPHGAIRAPQAEQKSFAEVLADYDQRCHARYRLDSAAFRLKLPVHLLDEAGQKRYVNRVAGFMPPQNNIMQAPPTPEEFKGAAGMHSFTAVYFNRSHTLAMTEIGMYCGSLCGNWQWVVLQRTHTGWQTMPWVVMNMMS